MSDKLLLVYTPSLSVYFNVWNRDGQIWRTDTEEFGTFSNAQIANYDVAMTEQGTASGRYVGTFPAGITRPARYNVVYHERVGVSPAVLDTPLGSTEVDWEGTGFIAPETVFAMIKFGRNNQDATDKYTVGLFLNGARLLGSQITSATLQILNRDGSERKAATALNKSDSSYVLNLDVSGAARLASGTDGVAVVSAVIRGNTYTFQEPVGRDLS